MENSRLAQTSGNTIIQFDKWLFSLLRQVTDLLFSFEALFVLSLYSGLVKQQRIFEGFLIDVTVFFFSASIVIGAWILYKRKETKISTKLAHNIAWCSGFFIYAIISVGWSTGGEFSSKKALLMVPLPLISFLLASIIIAPEVERVSRFLNCIIAFNLWTSISTYQHYLTGNYYLYTSLEIENVGDSISRGMVLNTGVAAAYAKMLFARRNSITFYVMFLICITYLTGILVTGSKQALVGVILFFLFSFFTKIKPDKKERRLLGNKSAKFIIIGVVLAIGIGVVANSDLDLLTIQRFQYSIAYDDVDDSVIARESFRVTTLNEWLKSPFVGYGIGSFGSMLGAKVDDHPHNIFVEILFELGAVGLTLFLGLLFSLATKLSPWTLFFSNPIYVGIAFALIGLGFSALVSSTFAENRVLFSFLAILTIEARAINKQLD